MPAPKKYFAFSDNFSQLGLPSNATLSSTPFYDLFIANCNVAFNKTSN